MATDNIQTRTEQNGDDKGDSTAPFYELEAFDSIWKALRWKQIRARVPVCLKKTIHSRYMLANLVYLVYAIGILIIDFNSSVNGSSTDNTVDGCDNTTITDLGLDQLVDNNPMMNRFYVGNEIF